MIYKKHDIWLADLNPRRGTEPGKTRPIVIVQTNLLNKVGHPSTLICPITSNVKKEAKILRVHLHKEENNLKQDCDILVEQLRAIDNQRFIKKIGALNKIQAALLSKNLKVILDLE